MFSFRSSFKLRIGMVEEWELIVMDAFWLEQMTIEKDFAPLVTYRKSRKIYHKYNLHAHFIVRRWYDKNIFHRPKATSPLRFRTFNLLYVFLLIMKAHNIPIIMNKYYKTCRCAVTGSLKLDNFIILTFIAIVYHDWF